MINRRHLRIKVMQILYSQYAANSKSKELLKILEERSLKFYLFFITYLLLVMSVSFQREKTAPFDLMEVSGRG